MKSIMAGCSFIIALLIIPLNINIVVAEQRDLDNNSEDWYAFLADVHYILTDFAHTPNAYKHDFPGRDEQSSDYRISKQDFKGLIDKFSINNHDISKYRSLNPTPSQLQELSELYRVTSEFSTELNSDTLYVRGNNIKFSDFINDEGQLIVSGVYPKKLVVFALYTIFIDRNLNSQGEDLQVLIIAPVIHVIGSRLMNLSGKAAENSNSLIAIESQPGAPGNPGKPGGSFYAIATSMRSSKYLMINVGGGAGGPGQDGGRGKDGETDLYAADLEGQTYPPCSLDICKPDKPFIIAKTQTNISREFRCSIQEFLDLDPAYTDAVGICGIIVHNIDGTSGSDGADGGAGGLGGQSGKVVLIFPKGYPHGVRFNETGGGPGKNGRGGEGGTGRNAKGYMAMVYGDGWQPFMGTDPWNNPMKQHYEGKKLKDGKKGVDGNNMKGLKESMKAEDISQSMYSFINRYKSYARKFWQYPTFRRPLTNFLTYLNKNDEIDNYYDTIALAEELKALEEEIITQSSKSKNDLYFGSKLRELDIYIPFYELLKERILAHSKKLNESEDSRERKRVLAYAYASASTRIYNLKDYSSRNLVFDVRSFLHYISQKFNGLRNKEKTSIIQTMKDIDTYRYQTVEHFEGKIKEAREFVSRMNPELQNFERRLRVDMDRLIREFQAAENQQLDAIRNKQKELRRFTGAAIILGILRVAGFAISFLGPVGMAVGEIITTTVSVVDPILIPRSNITTPTQKGVAKVPATAQSIENLVKSVQEAEIKSLNKTLARIIKEGQELGEEHKEKLEILTKKTEELQTRLGPSQKPLSSKMATELEKELEETLEKQHKLLEKEKKAELEKEKVEAKIEKINEKYKKPLKFIETGMKLVKLGVENADYILSLANHEKILRDDIAAAEKQFQDLRTTERRIYSEMQPAIDQMENYLQSTRDRLKDQSRVALVVSRLEVQTCLRDLMQRLKEFTEGSKVQGSLLRTIEQFEDTLNTLISLYDFMEHYQESEMTIHFIANVMNAAVNKAQFKDIKLAEAEDNLEKVVIYNTLLKQYYRAVGAFKQFAFPFTSELEMQVPAELHWETYLSDVIDHTAKRIQLLVDEVEEQRPSVGQYQHCLQQGPFNKDVVGVGPFFVWGVEDHADAIANLLSGKEVTLSANIRRSPLKIDAIKFNEINLKFIATNGASQQRLNDDLKKFGLTLQHGGDSYYRYNHCKIVKIVVC